MFSIVNEIKDNSPGNMVRMVVSSIGTAACIYLVVGVTGYITFGNAVKGNIVMMCMYFDQACNMDKLTAFQTPQTQHPPLARPQLLSWSYSLSRCRFTPAEHRLMLSSNGAPTALRNPTPAAMDRLYSPRPALAEVTTAALHQCRIHGLPYSLLSFSHWRTSQHCQ